MIYTNRVLAQIDDCKINRDFDIYEVSREYGSFFKTNVLDIPTLKFKAVSVVYTWGNKWYVMFKKDEVDKKKLKETLEEEISDIKLRKITFGEDNVYPNVKLQLILNTLKQIDDDGNYNNTMGKLYIYEGDREKDKNSNIIKSFWLLSLTITSDLCIDLQVNTFSNLNLFKSKKVLSMPRYIFDEESGVLRRLLKGEKQEGTEVFIQKSLDKSKHNTMSFLNIESYNKFLESKVGVLEKFIIAINDRMGEYIKIELDGYQNYSEFEENKNWCEKLNYKELIKKRRLLIEDAIKDTDSMSLVDDIKKYAYEKYNIEIKEGAVEKNAYNIRIIHNQEYYETLKMVDQHICDIDSAIVQHVTIEDFKLSKENQKEKTDEFKTSFNFDKVLQELLIKDDLRERKINLINWNSIGYESGWTFVKKYGYKKSEESKKNDAALYGIIKIKKNGEFITEIYDTEAPFQMNFEFDDIEDIYKTYAKKDIEGLFYKDIDNINIIIKTKERTWPNSKETYNRLKLSDGKKTFDKKIIVNVLNEITNEDKAIEDKKQKILTYLNTCGKNVSSEEIYKNGFGDMRSKASKFLNEKIYENTGVLVHPTIRERDIKENLFKSILGIKYFEKDGKLYYFVGTKSKGMNQNFPNSCVIREVIGKKSEFEEIVNLLDVEFVKNGQYTVVPFVYKYLNEILKDEYRKKLK